MTHRKFIECPCCGAMHTQESFTHLRKLRKGDFQDDFSGGWLELRNCSCGSTISRQLAPAPTKRSRDIDPESPRA